MRIRVLGAFEAEVSGVRAALGGPRQRAVLALLVAARGQVVSVDRLIEDLWHGEPPAQAVTTLQSYISNLRRLLEPERAPRAPARVLVSVAPGYALRLPDDAVDAWRFGALVREPDRSAEALALWRGPAFAEFADAQWGPRWPTWRRRSCGDARTSSTSPRPPRCRRPSPPPNGSSSSAATTNWPR
ncbi:winged helix-turn-helix domain-containing protein [Actinomadura sp. LOL_016]|uniref:AfsR/SARP family transcriptional regulator n=1 Tax=unclassified Actinomadura TaxID=2626254 RepID=UPI003A80C08C